jgi:hypothetical protein
MEARPERLAPGQIRHSRIVVIVAAVGSVAMVVLAFALAPAWRGLSGAVALAYIAWFHWNRVQRDRRQDAP